MTDDLAVLSEALASHESVQQVLGCMNKETNGLHVIVDGEQYIVTIRPRNEEESFVLYEMPDLGEKGLSRK